MEWIKRWMAQTQAQLGDLTISHIQGNGPDEHYIKDVRWISKAEMKDMVVYPDILKDEFWADLAQGFPETRYLGVQVG